MEILRTHKMSLHQFLSCVSHWLSVASSQTHHMLYIKWPGFNMGTKSSCKFAHPWPKMTNLATHKKKWSFLSLKYGFVFFVTSKLNLYICIYFCQCLSVSQLITLRKCVNNNAEIRMKRYVQTSLRLRTDLGGCKEQDLFISNSSPLKGRIEM